MSFARTIAHTDVRAWMTLGRISNLPTVWSNCLAAWLLGGGGSPLRFALLAIGATLLYLAGMFLNDAWDAAFDRKYRRERPIPSGLVTEREVWIGGAATLLLGLILLSILGWATALLGLLLALAILVYNATHKSIPFSPVVMALCRYLLFLAAGSASARGAQGLTAWSALALGGYIVGLSYVAKGESTGGLKRWWPLAGLAVPLVLALFANPPSAWVEPIVAAPAVMLIIWCARALTRLFRPDEGPRRTVSDLLAGIVLVDLLAVAAAPLPWGMVFLALFGAALLLQRAAPAT
jgi:hypothetical protein